MRTRQNGQSIPEDEVLVTWLLSDFGYTCGLAGKLHLSRCDPPDCPDTERRIDDAYEVFHWSHAPDPDWPATRTGIGWSGVDRGTRRPPSAARRT